MAEVVPIYHVDSCCHIILMKNHDRKIMWQLKAYLLQLNLYLYVLMHLLTINLKTFHNFSSLKLTLAEKYSNIWLVLQQLLQCFPLKLLRMILMFWCFFFFSTKSELKALFIAWILFAQINSLCWSIFTCCSHNSI